MVDCSCSNFPASLGNVTFGASVGIGTSAPAYPLDVGGPGSAATIRVNRLTVADDNVNTSLQNANAGAMLFYNSVGGADANLAYRFHATTAKTPLLNILNNGNVGIGTTTPTTLLAVAGTISYDSGTAGLVGLIDNDFHAIRSNGQGAQVFANRWGIATQGWVFRDDAYGVDRVVIESAGNVGIGTTAPAHALDVSGDVNTSGSILASGHKVADGSGCYYS